MTEAQVLDILEKVGAFRSGHFVLTSRRHSDAYINKDAMYAYTRDLSRLCKSMAERFKDADVEAVIGPAIGAAILAQWVAHHLSELTHKEVYAVYADKDGQGGFVLKRGYDGIVKGKRTLIVEDLTTTGASIKKVLDAAETAGAHILGAITICNRGGVQRGDVGNPPVFDFLANVHLESWDENTCELCKKGIPINTDIGHGGEFLARKK